MENLNYIVAKQLISLRKSKKLTQLELAEKLNYSDKSISKWEKGEAIPSLEVLVEISKMFEVPLDYFIKEKYEESITKPLKKPVNKLVITLISLSVVWLVALITYIVFSTCIGVSLWEIFVWAVPVCAIVCIVFSALWSAKHRYIYISASLLNWSALTALYFQLISNNLWMLFMLGIPIQAGIILWAFLKK